eukprot:349730-Chlamydomonas_euryale.AAC.8
MVCVTAARSMGGQRGRGATGNTVPAPRQLAAWERSNGEHRPSATSACNVPLMLAQQLATGSEWNEG